MNNGKITSKTELIKAGLDAQDIDLVLSGDVSYNVEDVNEDIEASELDYYEDLPPIIE